MSAVSQVFGITELVETILSHATMTDVLRCQRINRSVKHTIDFSPTLQEKLFFKAAKVPEWMRTGAYAITEGREMNETLLEVLGAEVREAFGTGEVAGRRSALSSRYDFQIRFRSTLEFEEEVKAGSWSRMLLIQPPVFSTAGVDGFVDVLCYGKKKTRQLHTDEKSIRLQALERLADDMAREARVCGCLAWGDVDSGSKESRKRGGYPFVGRGLMDC